jgi:hypothetical protein
MEIEEGKGEQFLDIIDGDVGLDEDEDFEIAN